MLPRLFDFQDILADYQNNLSSCQNQLGHGYFTHIKSNEVKEVLNGEYTLKMTILTTDPLAKTVQPDMCILAKPNYSDDPQVFIVTTINYKDDGTIDINGEHIKGMFFNNVVLGNSTQEDTEYTGTPSEIVNGNNGLLSEVISTNYFTFSSDITTSTTIKRSGSSVTLGEVFDNSDRGIIKKFSGDLKFNNFSVSFLAHRGKTAASERMAENVVRYGEKISSFSQEMTNEGEYSHILPYAEVATSDGYNDPRFKYDGPIKSLVLYGQKNGNYLIQTESGIGFTKILPVDLSKYFTDKHGYVNPGSPSAPQGYGFEATRELIYDLGKSWLSTHQSLKTPSVSINVNYESALDELSKVDLGDVVTVIYDPVNYIKNHRVTETVYDFVNEKYKSVTIGYRKFTLYDYLKQLRR